MPIKSICLKCKHRKTCTLQYQPFGLNGVTGYASPTFVDIDNDGDLDAFVGETLGNVVYFANAGTASVPAFGLAFAPAITNAFGLTNVGRRASPEFADIDYDGDYDMFVGNSAGNTMYFENTGSATAPAFGTMETNPFGLVNVGKYSSPVLVDINSNGILDMFIGEFLGNTVYFRGY